MIKITPTGTGRLLLNGQPVNYYKTDSVNYVPIDEIAACLSLSSNQVLNHYRENMYDFVNKGDEDHMDIFVDGTQERVLREFDARLLCRWLTC